MNFHYSARDWARLSADEQHRFRRHRPFGETPCQKK